MRDKVETVTSRSSASVSYIDKVPEVRLHPRISSTHCLAYDIVLVLVLAHAFRRLSISTSVPDSALPKTALQMVTGWEPTRRL